MMSPSRRSPPLAVPPPAAFPAPIVARHLRPALSGDVSGRYRRPTPPACTLRRRLRLFSSPDTSAGTLRRHFRAFPLPGTPAGTLRRRFGAFPLPVTSGRHSPAAFPAPIVARHPCRTSPATFRGISVARHLRLHSPATFLAAIVARHSGRHSPATFKAFFVARHLRPSLSGDVSGRYRRQTPPPIPLRRRFWPLSLPDTSGRHDTAGLNPSFPGDRIARNAVPVASRLQICQRCAQLGSNTLPTVDMLCVTGAIRDGIEREYARR